MLKLRTMVERQHSPRMNRITMMMILRRQALASHILELSIRPSSSNRRKNSKLFRQWVALQAACKQSASCRQWVVRVARSLASTAKQRCPRARPAVIRKYALRLSRSRPPGSRRASTWQIRPQTESIPRSSNVRTMMMMMMMKTTTMTRSTPPSKNQKLFRCQTT